MSALQNVTLHFVEYGTEEGWEEDKMRVEFRPGHDEGGDNKKGTYGWWKLLSRNRAKGKQKTNRIVQVEKEDTSEGLGKKQKQEEEGEKIEKKKVEREAKPEDVIKTIDIKKKEKQKKEMEDKIVLKKADRQETKVKKQQMEKVVETDKIEEKLLRKEKFEKDVGYENVEKVVGQETMEEKHAEKQEECGKRPEKLYTARKGENEKDEGEDEGEKTESTEEENDNPRIEHHPSPILLLMISTIFCLMLVTASMAFWTVIYRSTKQPELRCPQSSRNIGGNYQSCGESDPLDFYLYANVSMMPVVAMEDTNTNLTSRDRRLELETLWEGTKQVLFTNGTWYTLNDVKRSGAIYYFSFP